GVWLYHLDNFANSLNQQQFHRTSELFDLADLQAIAKEHPSFRDIDDAWLPDVQLMISRLAHGLFVAAHAGNNGRSHNHNDVGDFIVYVAGEPVIIDVGSGTYTARTFSKDRYRLWFNTSPFHNLPAFNGQDQQAGLEFSAGHVVYQKGHDKAILKLNGEKAYP